MNDRYRRLLRATPDRHAPGPGAFATEPRALRSWVAALPLANFNATAKMLREGLQQLNRMRIDGSQRLDALEILRHPIAQLAELTDKQIVGASFPLPPQKLELGTIALEFQSELALGYRIALAELCAPSGHVPFMRTKQVALAAVRALLHGGEHLSKAYLLYRTPPAGAWQALHDVYRFAAMVRLDDRAVEDPLLGSHVGAKLAYAHAILLALANPYRYTQRELLEVIAFTRTVAPYVEIRTGAGNGTDINMSTDADHGPGYLPEERVAGDIEVLSIRLDALFKFIEGQIAMLPPGARVATFRLRGGPPVAIDIELARRLVAGWTATGERAHERLGGGYVLDTVLGLHDLHFVLVGNEDFESFLRRVRGQAISLSESDRIASWAISASEPARAARLKARVLDQSLGGYRLLWDRGPGGETVRARIGELVGLALPEDTDTPDWMVGAIRWIRIDDQGRVDAGVELLSRRALPVGVRNLDETGIHASMRGLLLTSLREDEDGYTSLITPGLFERASGTIELTLPVDPQGPPAPARTERVRGMGLVEATGIYLQFALPPLQAPAEPANEDDTEPRAAAGG